MASIAAAAGCGVPLVLVLAGVGASWLSTLHRLKPLMPVFVIATVGSLAYAAWHIFRRTKTHQSGHVCVDASAQRRRKLLFWFVLVLNAGMLLVPLLLIYMV
jgi:FtsH-binding integral membrane protein